MRRPPDAQLGEHRNLHDEPVESGLTRRLNAKEGGAPRHTVFQGGRGPPGVPGGEEFRQSIRLVNIKQAARPVRRIELTDSAGDELGDAGIDPTAQGFARERRGFLAFTIPKRVRVVPAVNVARPGQDLGRFQPLIAGRGVIGQRPEEALNGPEPRVLSQ